MARATAGGSGTRTTLPPLPRTRRTRWPCSSPRSAMLAPQASKIRRPSRPKHGDQGEVVGVGRSPGGGDQGLELQVRPARGSATRPARWGGGRSRPASASQDCVDDAGAVEARPPPTARRRHRGWLEPAYFLHPAHVQLDLCPAAPPAGRAPVRRTTPGRRAGRTRYACGSGRGSGPGRQRPPAPRDRSQRRSGRVTGQAEDSSCTMLHPLRQLPERH